MKRKQWRKKWFDRRSRKLQNSKYHRIKSIHSMINADISTDNKVVSRIHLKEYKGQAPKIFSFIENPKETIEFFADFTNEILKKVHDKLFYIDSQFVEKVSIDVLVYIIALTRNVKINQTMRYNFAGNLPKEDAAKRMYEESGFLNFFNSKAKKLPKNTDKMQIVTGKTTDTELAKQMCEFVMQKLNEKRKFTNVLYKTLIELMSNAVHHAYNKDDIMYPVWYLYAESTRERIRFIFVDTGSGIAKTVRKNFWEKINLKSCDSDLIYSAFEGDFRTETKLTNRGHGLPAIRDYIEKKEFSDFRVLSGSGECKLNIKGHKLEKNEYEKKINGTIYVFEIENKRRAV